MARRTAGLEPALIENARIEISSLEPETDPRRFTLRVAGPAALLVAKLTKIRERSNTPKRRQPKDALDVLRLLQTAEPEALADTLRMLAGDRLSAEVTLEATEFLRSDGTRPDGNLARLALEATEALADPETITGSMNALVEDLLDGLGGRA